jgi:hypothetical protein
VLSIEQRARVWNMLDDVQRARIEAGEITFEQAAELVIPLGDLEAERYAAEAPAPAPAPAVGLDGTPLVNQEGEYTGSRWDAQKLFYENAAQTWKDKYSMHQFGAADFALNATEADIAGIQERSDSANALANVSSLAGPLTAPLQIAARLSGLRDQRNVNDITAVQSDEVLKAETQDRLLHAISKLEAGEDVKREYAAMLDKYDILRGGRAAGNIIAQPEQSLTAVTGVGGVIPNPIVAGISRVLAIPAAAVPAKIAYDQSYYEARKTGGLSPTDAADFATWMAASEYALEFGSGALVGPAKREFVGSAIKEWAKRTGKVAAAEGLTESGTVLVQHGGNLAISQGDGAIANYARELLPESASEVLVEMYDAWLAGAGTSGVMTSPVTAVETAGRNLTRNLEAELGVQAADATVRQELANLDRQANQQATAEANREIFDAEMEADRLIEEYKANQLANNAVQTELPLGSEMTADPTANDRVPTIVDMFSGESRAAPNVQTQLAQQVPADKTFTRLPEETDQAFEIRKQREQDAKRQVAARQAEDQTILKNERQLQSTADITREAERRLQVEQEAIRRMPANRRGRANARLGETLEAHARKRKPELVAEVREERLARINQARERQIDLENRELERKAREQAAPPAPPQDDLFGNVPQADPATLGETQQALPGTTVAQPEATGFTGTLTERQRQQELAAGQLQRQRNVEQRDPKQKAELEKAIEAEMPLVSKAVDRSQTARANLTVKRYGNDEAKALGAIVKQELDTPNDTRTADEVKKAVAARMAEWRRANPRPANAPAPVADPIAADVKKVQSDRTRAQKTKETKRRRALINRELRNGATPEEAEANVRRQLTPDEDAAAREELGGTTTTRSPDAVRLSTRDQYSDAVQNTDALGGKWAESRSLRVSLNSILNGNSQTKVGDLLRAVIANKDTTRGERWLAQRLVGLADNINIKLVPVDMNPEFGRWGGAYDPSEHAVWIRVATASVILHEVLHGVTSNLLSSSIAKNNPKLKSAIAQLDYVLVTANQMWASQDQSLVSPELAKLLNNAEGGPLSNATELISYALTDFELMQWLESIDMPGQKKTAWTAFKDAIKTIFTPRNAEQNNALDMILDATATMVEVQEATPALSSVFTAARRQRRGLGFTKPDAQLIEGLKRPGTIREGDLKSTLAALVKKYPKLLAAIEFARSSTGVGNWLTNFNQNIWNTPLEEMADRTIDGVDPAAYRRALNDMPSDVARWARSNNRLIMDDGSLLPLFHGSKDILPDNDGRSYRVFRMPDDTEQLGAHFSVTPQTASSFNTTITPEQTRAAVDSRDSIHVMAGRMANPLRLVDNGTWNASEIAAQLRAQLPSSTLTSAAKRDLIRKLDQLAAEQADNGYSNDPAVRQALLDAGIDGVVYLNRYELAVPHNSSLAMLMAQRLAARGTPVATTDYAELSSLREAMSDAEYKDLFPEASESFIFLRPQDFKSLSDERSGAVTEGPDMYAVQLESDTEVAAEPFSNPTSKRAMIVLGKAGKWEITARAEWLSNPVGAMLDFLTNGMGYNAKTTEALEAARGTSSAMIQRASTLFRSIDHDITRQAVAAKKDIQAYRRQFNADITAFEEATGLEKSQKAKAIADKYGQAANAYFDMRNTMDSLSNDILQQRLADPTPFTTEEVKIYRSIKENIGKYYTRVYALNTPKVGAEWAAKLWKEYTKTAEALKNKLATNPEFMDGYQIVADAIRYVRDNMMTIPDIETLETMPIRDLTRLADAWGVSPMTQADLDNPMTAESKREMLVEGLDAVAESTPEARDSRAMALVERTLFNQGTGTLTNYYRGAKQDRTIVTEREMVPEPIRKLLGEHTDLAARGMVTIVRQAEFRARNAAFRELLTLEEGKRLFTEQDLTAAGLSSQDFTELSGVAYGVLDGMWARNDLAVKIEDSAQVARTLEQALAMADEAPLNAIEWTAQKGLRGWAATAGFQKALQLVYNMGNLLMNFGGGGLIMLSNGGRGFAHMKRAFQTAKDLMANAALDGGVLTPDMEKVVRAEITDSAYMGAIKATELEKLRDVSLEAVRTKLNKQGAAAVGVGKRMNRAWREMYAMADIVWKIANFYAEEAYLTEVYKAEGIDVTPEAIEREAAARTNVSNFSYKRVPNLIKIIEKGGITYIAPYIYETFRAPIGSLVLGLTDLRRATKAETPEGRNILMRNGLARTTGAFLSMGIAQQVAYATIKAMLGQDDEDENMIEKLRPFLPSFSQDGEFAYLGRDRNNNAVLFELSRLDPMGPANELYKKMLTAEDPDAVWEEVKGLVIGNPLGSSLLQAVLGTGGTSTRLERIDPLNYARLVAAVDSMPLNPVSGAHVAKVVDKMFPSWLARAADPNNLGNDEDTLSGLMTRGMPLMGIQMHNVDVEKSVQFVARSFAAEQRDIRGAMYDWLKIAVDPSAEDILSKTLELREREKESYKELMDTYNGLIAMEVPPAQAMAFLKANRVRDQDLVHLAMGGYVPEASNIVSVNNIVASLEIALKDENWTTEKKERYLANVRQTLSLVQQGDIPQSK